MTDMILFTGRGTSGSWQIRGAQMAQAMGAKALPKARQGHIASADTVVVVKRMTPELSVFLKGKRWVWDLVDFYPQPECTEWCRSEAIAWVKSQIQKHNPTGVIFANKRMQMDCKTSTPSTAIHHHHRPDIKLNPIRKEVQSVAYEGAPAYLGKWAGRLISECNRRGWDFMVNPRYLADCDIVVAFRDDAVNGYVQRHWKSNVKLANAHGSGTPFIGPCESGYSETATGYERWLESPEGLSAALDELECYELRKTIHRQFISSRLSVHTVAQQYRDFIDSL